MISRILLSAALLCLASGCGCRSHNLRTLPARDSAEYRRAFEKVSSDSRILTMRMLPRHMVRNSREARFLERAGYLRYDRIGGLTFTKKAKREAIDHDFSSFDTYGEFILGIARVRRLTFFDHDDSFCSPYGDANDEYGYVATVVSLSPLGRRLEKEGLLMRGNLSRFRGLSSQWDGKADLEGILSILQDGESFGLRGVQVGQTLGLPSSFEYLN